MSGLQHQCGTPPAPALWAASASATGACLQQAAATDLWCCARQLCRPLQQLQCDSMADEAGFLELLVANERVGRWLDLLCDPFQRGRHAFAISQLHQDLQKGPCYVEEACRMGAVQVLTKLLSQTSLPLEQLTACEATMDEISQIICICSGPLACGGKVCSFSYGGVTVHLREGALGDGLGAKVWSVCHIMCRELVRHPEIFRDQVVLELGSGTGLVGIVAALAGARQVVLTDNEQEVLRNLRTCMHMNTSGAAAAVLASASQQQQQQQQQGQQQQELPDDSELFDDAESVDDLDLSALVLEEPAGAGKGSGSKGGGNSSSSSSSCGQAPRAGDPLAAAAAAAAQQTAWEAGNMAVRLLDWQESADALAAGAAGSSSSGGPAPAEQPAAAGGGSDGVPGVPLDQTFNVILGNEVMYEPAHAALVAAAIRHRLARGGRALLCCAVRSAAVFEQFAASCAGWGLRYRMRPVQPRPEDLGGIQGRQADYEGGYLLMAVDFADGPAADWHRADFEPVAPRAA